MAELTAVPMEMIASIGIPKSSENFGMRYQALNMLPKTLMTAVPSARDKTAPFFESVA